MLSGAGLAVSWDPSSKCCHRAQSIPEQPVVTSKMAALQSERQQRESRADGGTPTQTLTPHTLPLICYSLYISTNAGFFPESRRRRRKTRGALLSAQNSQESESLFTPEETIKDG